MVVGETHHFRKPLYYLIGVMPLPCVFSPFPTGSEDTQAQLQAQSSLGEACPSAGGSQGFPTSLRPQSKCTTQDLPCVFLRDNMAKVGAEFCASIIFTGRDEHL